jgi:hypothetical protein
MRIAAVWGCVMRIEEYREKYRLRSGITMEWYSVLTTVKESRETEKKEKKIE